MLEANDVHINVTKYIFAVALSLFNKPLSFLIRSSYHLFVLFNNEKYTSDAAIEPKEVLIHNSQKLEKLRISTTENNI